MALVLGITAALVPHVPEVGAQTADPAGGAGVPGKAAPPPDASPGGKTPPSGSRGDFAARLDIRTDESGKKVITIEKSGDPDTDRTGWRSKVITIDKSGVVMEDAGENADAAGSDGPTPGAGATSKQPGKRIQRGGAGGNDDFDSFDRLLENQPALAAMILGIVAVVFLAPVLAIGLILVYRFRRLRMQNEAMLKLAEKGVVPPAEALDALATGKPGPVLAEGAGTKPLYEQARRIRQRAAWSDLRKGILMGGVGLALSLYSMVNSGRANAIGLVLLFVGIGYALLWWFEDRKSGAHAIAPPAPAAGPPSPPAA
jgi:hypothetical protein